MPSSRRSISTYNHRLLVRSLKTHLRVVISTLRDLLILFLHSVGCFVKFAQRQKHLCLFLISGNSFVILGPTMLSVWGENLHIADSFMLLVLSLKKLIQLLGLFLKVLSAALHHVLLVLDSCCKCNFFASLPLDVVLALS